VSHTRPISRSNSRRAHPADLVNWSLSAAPPGECDRVEPHHGNMNIHDSVESRDRAATVDAHLLSIYSRLQLKPATHGPTLTPDTGCRQPSNDKNKMWPIVYVLLHPVGSGVL